MSTGEPLFKTRMSAFIRGEGGFGGDRGPSGHAERRRPTATPTTASPADPSRPGADLPPVGRPQPAALGSRRSPRWAASTGRSCTGCAPTGSPAGRLLHALCGSDPARFKGLDGRFSSPVLPGEALTVKMWEDGDGSAIFQTCGEDGRVVIDAGRVTYTLARAAASEQGGLRLRSMPRSSS